MENKEAYVGLAYLDQMAGAASASPVLKELVQGILTTDHCFKQVLNVLENKIPATKADNDYHWSLAVLQTDFEEPSWCLLEVGSTPDIETFERFARTRNYNSYSEYIDDILLNPQKGLKAFEALTGELPPSPISEEYGRSVVFGHVVANLSSQCVHTSTVWKSGLEKSAILSAELMFE